MHSAWSANVLQGIRRAQGFWCTMRSFAYTESVRLRHNTCARFSTYQSAREKSSHCLEKIIYRPLDKDSSDREISSFKMAFVMFVVGYLLAPSPSHDHTNTQYWGAIAQIDDVAEFNWCEYVLGHLMPAVEKLKADMERGSSPIHNAGCHLFLQVA